MSNQLLEKAIKVPVGRRRHDAITEDEIGLAIAWLMDAVSIHQIAVAVDFPLRGSNFYSWVALRLREGARRRKLRASQD